MKSLVLLDFLGTRLKASSKSSLNGPFFQRKKSTCFNIRREFSRKELTLKLPHNSPPSMLFLKQYPIFKGNKSQQYSFLLIIAGDFF